MYGLPEPPSPHGGKHDEDKTMNVLSDIEMFIRDTEQADRRYRIFIYISWFFVVLVVGLLMGLFLYWAYILTTTVRELLILFFEPINSHSSGW